MLIEEHSTPLLSEQWKAAIQLAVESLIQYEKDESIRINIQKKLQRVWLQYDQALEHIGKDEKNRVQAYQVTAELFRKLKEFDHYMIEMGHLEEKMSLISDEGQNLVVRLTGKPSA